jgi:hypothetical protein
MYKVYNALLFLILLLPEFSCKKIMNYFREPETEILTETIHSTALTGYAANLAMAVMAGQTFSNVSVTRSNPGFPCTTLMVVDPSAENCFYFAPEKASAITIAGLWPDESTAILTLLYTNYNTGTSVLDLLGIETIPVIRDGNNIHVALASMDIRLNPDQGSFLQLNLNTLEIQSELLRLEAPRPADVYVALEQNAYYIDVDNQGTDDHIADDSYTLTGGGQLIEVAGNSAEIVQQAMIEVNISPACITNPVAGIALMKVTGLESDGFPELGTAILECGPTCDGMAHVFIATGMYVGSNGQDVPFRL